MKFIRPGSRGWAWLIGVLLLVPAMWAHAQASRTWVSGVGDDANPCSRTAPCHSLAAAYAKTMSGGEIDVLDPGVIDGSNDMVVPPAPVVGPATFTIDKPITINGGAGQVAALGGIAQGDSIVINMPTPGSVILRNLRLNGFGVGNNGIRISSQSNVVIEHLDISGYAQNCLLIDPTAGAALVDVSYSVFSNCGTGVANKANTVVNLGDETAVLLNSVVGVSSNNPQGAVYLSGATIQGNTQGTDFTPYVSGLGATVSGGGAGCTIASQQFLAPSSITVPLPAGVQRVAGAGLHFDSTYCTPGSAITVTLTYAQAMPANTGLYKFDPGTSTWSPVVGAVLSADRMTFTYSITDNGPGDTNSAPGYISDPAWPLQFATTAMVIPTMSTPGLLVLAVLVLAMQAWLRRRSAWPRR